MDHTKGPSQTTESIANSAMCMISELSGDFFGKRFNESYTKESKRKAVSKKGNNLATKMHNVQRCRVKTRKGQSCHTKACTTSNWVWHREEPTFPSAKHAKSRSNLEINIRRNRQNRCTDHEQEDGGRSRNQSQVTQGREQRRSKGMALLWVCLVHWRWRERMGVKFSF